MIRYALVCAAEHRFEAWFRDSEAFDRQSDAGQLSCSICGSTEAAYCRKSAGAIPRR